VLLNLPAQPVAWFSRRPRGRGRGRAAIEVWRGRAKTPEGQAVKHSHVSGEATGRLYGRGARSRHDISDGAGPSLTHSDDLSSVTHPSSFSASGARILTGSLRFYNKGGARNINQVWGLDTLAPIKSELRDLEACPESPAGNICEKGNN
jgi:hypothetical protein